MSVLSINLDRSRDRGAIRRIHGINNAAPLSYIFGSERHDVTGQLKALECPAIRFHDAVLENPGLQLVDISRIFPNAHADVDDPRNYHFAATDDYIANAIAAGCGRIEFRLGESIEHSRKQYAVHPPSDPKRWAEICCHIISHYNEGWASGFRHRITDWSIWEEPDTVPMLFTGAMEEYLDLYCVTAKAIKERFPGLRVGGPNCSAHNPGFQEQFLECCRAADVPLDFFAWTGYCRDPEDLIDLVPPTRERLDRYGFSATELNISEWHYGPASWNDIHGDADPATRAAAQAEIAGINGGAFTASALIGFQDVPVDMTYYYCCCLMSWALFDDRSRLPTPSYYALLAFAEIARYETRLDTDARPAPGVRVLAARDGDSGAALMISCFKAGSMKIKIDFAQAAPGNCAVRVLDAARSLEPEDPGALSVEGSRLTLHKHAPGSAVYLVTAG
jgi:hypothetical protein